METDSLMELSKSQLESDRIQNKSLLESALSGMTGRNALNHQKTLEAIDNFTEAFYQMYKLNSCVSNTSTINMQELLNRADEPLIQIYVKSLIKFVDIKYLTEDIAWSSRPYLHESIWIKYQAYRAIILHSFSSLKSIADGNKKNFLQYDSLKTIAISALPYKKDEILLIKEFSKEWLVILADLEISILADIKEQIVGNAADINKVEEAKKMMSQEKIQESFKANTAISTSTSNTILGININKLPKS